MYVLLRRCRFLFARLFVPVCIGILYVCQKSASHSLLPRTPRTCMLFFLTYNYTVTTLPSISPSQSFQIPFLSSWRPPAPCIVHLVKTDAYSTPSHLGHRPQTHPTSKYTTAPSPATICVSGPACDFTFTSKRPTASSTRKHRPWHNFAPARPRIQEPVTP